MPVRVGGQRGGLCGGRAARPQRPPQGRSRRPASRAPWACSGVFPQSAGGRQASHSGGLRGQQLRVSRPPRPARPASGGRTVTLWSGHLGGGSRAPCIISGITRLSSNAAPQSGDRPAVAAGAAVLPGSVLQEPRVCVGGGVSFLLSCHQRQVLLPRTAKSQRGTAKRGLRSADTRGRSAARLQPFLSLVPVHRD